MQDNSSVDKEIKLEVGYESVLIRKVYGPQIFLDLRISADPSDNTWKIEREVLMNDDSGNSWGEWIEWVRIPGQIDVEFRQVKE